MCVARVGVVKRVVVQHRVGHKMQEENIAEEELPPISVAEEQRAEPKKVEGEREGHDGQKQSRENNGGKSFRYHRHCHPSLRR